MDLDQIFSQIREAHTAKGFAPLTVQKAGGIEQSLGLVNYDLRRPALATYPFLESMRPIANSMPRVQGDGGTATHWKAITAIDTTQMPLGISEGNRGGVISQTLAEYTRPYRGFGQENNATFESQYASDGYDNAYGRATENLLRSVMLAEEPVIVFGNSTMALGITPTPTATGATTGGALSDGTYLVGCVALTPFGWQRTTVTNGISQTITRTNADGSQDIINGGCAQKSANSSGVVLSAGTAVQRVTANVTAVRGAVAYAWYLGTGSAATMYLQQITKINSVNFSTALVTSTQTYASLASTDYSALGTYTVDGLLTMGPFQSGSGAYYTALATGVDGTGTKLTSNGAAGITQIDDALKSFYDTWRTGPDEIWASAQHVNDMTKIVIAGGGTPLFRLNIDGSAAQAVTITGGNQVMGRYLNLNTGQILTVRIHPNLPDGVIWFRTVRSPYPISGVSNVQEVRYRNDWYQTEWPLRTRKREWGIYADYVVIDYMTFLQGAIVNVATGI